MENGKFQALRAWLQTHRGWLVQLNPIGVKYTDNHRNSLIEKVDYQLDRLARLERDCWDRAKVAAKVPGLYDLPDGEGPILIASRMSLPPNVLRVLIDECVTHSTYLGSTTGYGVFSGRCAHDGRSTARDGWRGSAVYCVHACEPPSGDSRRYLFRPEAAWLDTSTARLAPKTA